MAIAKNAAAIQFNGGNILPSSWPHGEAGESSLPTSHFAFWNQQHGGFLLGGSPFSLLVALSKGRPVQLPAESVQVTMPHSGGRALWRDNSEGSLGEFSLSGAYRALEAVLAGGNTLSVFPAQGQVYVGLHRSETRTSSLRIDLPADSTVLNLATGLDLQVRDVLRVTANPGGVDEVIRIARRILDTVYTIVRAEPGFDGSDTTAASHNAGNTVAVLEGPSLDNELVAAGAAFPLSPTVDQRFVFSAAATGLAGATDQEGAAVTSASADDSFIHNGRNWVLQGRGQGVLRDLGAVGYNRAEVVRESPNVAGVLTRYTDAQSFTNNQSGWIFSPR